MKYALNLAEDGRILSVTKEEFAPVGSVIVDELPDGNIYEYRYVDGEIVHDPLPDPEPEPAPPGNLEERVSAVESDVADLTAAIKKGLAL